MRILEGKTVAVLAIAFGFSALPAQAAGPKPVYRIDGVTVETQGNRVSVEARGAVRSGGWSDPRLVVKNSSGATLILELRATPPPSGDIVIQSLLPVTATTTLRATAAASTVQVISETNAVSQPIK